MIGDLCKPLNRGEQNTVRITMNVDEAARLHRELEMVFGPLRPHVMNTTMTAVEDLRHIVWNALERERGLRT